MPKKNITQIQSERHFTKELASTLQNMKVKKDLDFANQYTERM